MPTTIVAITERLLQPQTWPTSVWVLLFSGLATFVHQFLMRPPVPQNSPKFWKTNDLPFLGALRFQTARYNYIMQALGTLKGNFSFYIGKKHVVAMRGPDGRQAYYDNRDLNFGEGFGELFAGAPPNPSGTSGFAHLFNKSLITMLKKENFVRNLNILTSDTRGMCEKLAVAPSSKASPEWRVTNPFDSMYELVYRLTMRTVGASEIANDPKLLIHTLRIFERFEKSSSSLRIIFPWLPTPKHFVRMYNGARLYMVFQKLIEDRKKEGRREDDALQFLLDQGTNVRDVVTFEIGSLFAGQINSGINASWIPVHLSIHPEWKAKVRAEVDAVVAKYRSHPGQSPAEVLDSLTLDTWEDEFPLIDLCLRESIRLGIPGTSFRKNSSGADIQIGKTGEVIPNGSFALHLLDEMHMDPEIYPDPLRFDPGRYLPERAEDKKQPHSFLGWGSGRHPCLGMKFAKLEMSLIIAYFVAMFDFELSDRDGNQVLEPPPPVDRNQLQAQKPAKPTFLRYKPRAS